MHNITTGWLQEHGFKQYVYATGEIDIGTDIFPPEDATEIFMGCGPVSETIIQLGAVMTTAELFYLDNYPSGEVASARRTRQFYSYFSNGPSEPIGFSHEEKVYLGDYDMYDCQNWDCEISDMDDQRLSVLLDCKFIFFIFSKIKYL